MGAFCKQIVAFDMDVAFSTLALFLLLLFLYCQQYLDVHHLVKVASDPIELGGDVNCARQG